MNIGEPSVAATESPGSRTGAWSWSTFDVATISREVVADEINRRGTEIMRLRSVLAAIAENAECSVGLKAVSKHGDTFCAYHVARAALDTGDPTGVASPKEISRD